MRIRYLFFSLISLCCLTSCEVTDFNSNNASISSTSGEETSSTESGSTPSGTSTEESSDVTTESSSGDDTTTEPVPGQEGIVEIALDQKEQYLEIGKNTVYPFVYYLDADGNDIGESLSDDAKEVTFTSSNSSILEVNQYGKAKGVSVGNAFVICRTVRGNFECRYLIHVVTSTSNLRREYHRVDNIDTLQAGDTLVFGVPSSSSTASSAVVSSDLMSSSSTFSSDGSKITSLGSDSAEFMLGGSYNHWTLEVELESSSGRYVNKYLAAFNTKRIGYVNKTGNIEWEIGIDVDDGKLYIQSAANIYGWMMLNSNTGAYTLYESNENYHLFLPTIYRLTIVS